MLQWGRNFTVAERQRLKADKTPIGMLQWDRNFTVAERTWTDCGTSLVPGFNGAATLQLRKDFKTADEGTSLHASMGPQLYSCGKIHSSQYRGPVALASMGPQLYSCGKSWGRPRSQYPSIASMGPQLYSCGKPRPGSPVTSTHYRFNGAATLQLRKACAGAGSGA